ncbi:MAG: flagellar filament capping protein FliD [Chloroflexi bacterium]|nr:flagellar filament capping protein FliD [Chloroflexota bacterium]
MAGLFQFSGLVSGLDTKSIVQALLSAERKPIDQLKNRQTTIQTRLDAYSAINAKLATLKSKVFNLTLQSTLAAKSFTTDTPSTTSPIVSGSASASAASGTYQITVSQLATATQVNSGTPIGEPIDAAAALESAGFATDPTSGTFSINGVEISVDVTTDTLNSVIAQINASAANVTAQLVDDGNGNLNRLEITSNVVGQDVVLGAGADTSNFLGVAKLLASSAGETRTSTGNLGQAKAAEVLDDARLATALSAPTGTFTINGVEIDYDSTSDTLNAVISRINSSTAGVTASYDSVADKLLLVSKSTGSTEISVQDVDGNFLEAVGLLDADQTLGQNAEYSIDSINNGATLTSTSNTITDVISGVTINLLRADPATPVTVTIDVDPTKAVSAVKDFISAFNAVLTSITEQTKYDSAAQKAAPLLTDSTIFGILGTLRNKALDSVGGLAGDIQTLADVGITTGQVGSAVGTTNQLVFDEEKFTAALEENPEEVLQLFRGVKGGEGVATRLNHYVTDLTATDGVFATRKSSGDEQLRKLDNQISDMEDRLKDKEERLYARFAALEQTLARLQVQSQQLASQLNRLNSSQS